ncbi:hypothetical protein [Falsigemmobacter faecalis]|uniref:Uncharacterized protein n=1 Tax=Falsigemmobacter faecalis TaxID=2488730 RepID=A0A3P3DHG0_9RHOB|nr:hypothetical protein [Falsigemmobacter faecalis]RRH72008.1 hypothetical protein EG244_15960 [Falsigemmobacter faecalis]
MDCDYEFVLSSKVELGDWIKVSDGCLSLVLSDPPKEDSLVLADIDPSGRAVSTCWSRFRSRHVTRLVKPFIRVGAVGQASSKYADWDFPLALTSEGIILRVGASPEGVSSVLYHELVSNTGTKIRPESYAPIQAFTLWASHEAMTRSEDPLIHYRA